MKYDWEDIKRIYIEGYGKNGQVIFLSMKELSDTCKVDYKAVRLRASKNKWAQQREIYRKKLEYANKNAVSKLLANKGAEFDNKTLQVAEAGLLQIKAYFLAHKIEMKKAKKNKGIIPLLDYKVLDSLARAIVAFQKAGKLALGEQLPPEAPQSKIVFEFMREEKILSNEQREQFLKIAIRAEKEIFKDASRSETNK